MKFNKFIATPFLLLSFLICSYGNEDITIKIFLKKPIYYICIILYGCSDSKYEIYISPNGDDNAIGSLKDPIATLQHAFELARKQARKIPFTINLYAGLTI